MRVGLFPALACCSAACSVREDAPGLRIGPVGDFRARGQASGPDRGAASSYAVLGARHAGRLPGGLERRSAQVGQLSGPMSHRMTHNGDYGKSRRSAAWR